MTGIIDYGVGNLFSLESSLKRLDVKSEIVSDPAEVCKCDKIILPGVGAFKNAAEMLKKSGMSNVVKDCAESGMPILGICLGMQLLFEKSYEYGETEGLSILCGKVKPLTVAQKGLKIPHMGWNSLHLKKTSPLFKYVSEGEYVYFVHSFHAEDCEESVVATIDYGIEVCAAVGLINIFGTQFHPEKSGDTGLRILKAFGEL